MKYYIKYKGLVVGESKLTTMPGCRTIGISHGLVIYRKYRGMGIGSTIHQKRLALARSLGYSILVCTSRADNKPQSKILNFFLWTATFRFINPRTGHAVYLWYKTL